MKITDIQIAKDLLGKDGIVFVIAKDGEVLFSSSKKGIQPFFDALEKHPREMYSDCSIADRVIGKAALLLAAYLGATHVFTPLASQHAVDVALKLNLDLDTEKIVPYIINRSKDGMCPMESAVLDVNDLEEAYIVLKNKITVV